MTEPEQKRLLLFKDLYDAHVSTLIRFACRFTPADVSEDIVHDVFMNLWNSPTEFDPASIGAYLFVSVRNRCFNFLKQEQIKNLHNDNVRIKNKMLALGYFDSPEKSFIDREQIQIIYDEIDRLPEKCREIFKLAYYEEKKSGEIADTLNLSIRTVEHQIYLGLKALRNKLLASSKK